MKKRLLAAMLCVAVAASMGACGKSSTSSSDSSDTQGTGEETPFPDYSAGLTEEGFIDGIKAQDYVNIGEYKGMEISAKEAAITDEDFQEYIQEILKENGENQEVDRKIQDGDIVNIDYEGKIDGVAFEGGTAEGYNVEIGVTNFIDDFIEQLKGHEKGETFDIEVTFPESYSVNPDLAGKDATFTITINKVSEVIVPECNDAFVEENFPDYENAEVFLAEQREEFELSAKKNYVWTKMIENAEVKSYPEEYLQKYIDVQVSYYAYTAAEQGVTLEALLSSNGLTEETFMKDLTELCKLDVKVALCTQAICEAEGIGADEADLEKYMGIDEDTVDVFYNIYGKGYMYQSILLQKVAEAVVEYSVMVD